MTTLIALLIGIPILIGYMLLGCVIWSLAVDDDSWVDGRATDDLMNDEWFF